MAGLADWVQDFDARTGLDQAHASAQKRGGALARQVEQRLRRRRHRAERFLDRILATPAAVAVRHADDVRRDAGRHHRQLATVGACDGRQRFIQRMDAPLAMMRQRHDERARVVENEALRAPRHAAHGGVGQRRVLASFKGTNSAPTWSPDGRQLIVTLSRDGGSQLFVIDAQGGEPRRLTQSAGIDTEPVFSPDGTAIYFVSDRGGAPQIYRMPASGGPANRVTFNGTYNISPAISPDGRWLTYISRIGGAFKLHVMDIASGNVAAITDTNRDERPSFAPNSRLIVYATHQDGREALMTTTLDGRIKARLSGQGGDLREPNWGPFSKVLP